jgi:hypothetical protein
MTNPMNRVYSAMQDLVNSPALAFFTHYRKDFDVHDRREICDWGSPSAEWIWAVRESGTYLVRLGVSRRQDEFLIAVLNQQAREPAPERSAKLFHVRGSGQVRPIEVERARDLLLQPRQYELIDQMVFRSGERGQRVPIARGRLIWERGFAREPEATVTFEATPEYQPTPKQRWDDLAVLRFHASDMVVDDTGSLLSGYRHLLVDGKPFTDLFLTARQRATQHPAVYPAVDTTRRHPTPKNPLRAQPNTRSTMC